MQHVQQRGLTTMIAYESPGATAGLPPEFLKPERPKTPGPELDAGFDQQVAAYAPGGAIEQSRRPPAPVAQQAEPAEFGDPTPVELKSRLRDPGETAGVYDTTGRMLGRFRTDKGGRLYFFNPLIYEALRAYYGVETTEVFVDLEIEAWVLELWCSCYMDDTGFAKLKEIAVNSGDGPSFKERFYVVGYRPGNKVLEVIDLSEEVDAVDPNARQRASVDAKEARGVMMEHEAADVGLIILATGHTHPSTGEMEKNNHPSYHKDHAPLVSAEAKRRQGLPAEVSSPAFIATQEHGVSVYQTDTGDWDGSFYPGTNNAVVKGRGETDRYGIFDVYNFKGDHTYKDIRGDGAVDHYGNKDHTMASMSDSFKERRSALIEQLDAHRKDNGGRL